MSKAVVYQVKCVGCKGLRYVRKKAGPYRCKRCAKTAETPAAATPPAQTPALPRDPFYSDAARKAEIAERVSPRWMPKRPDWLQ